MFHGQAAQPGPETARWQRFTRTKNRREPRFECRPETHVTLFDLAGNCCQATAFNVSLGGIGLLLDQPLPIGTQLRLHVKHPQWEVPYELRGRVVHASHHTSQKWLIGCQLACQLTPADLEALLSDS